MREYKQPLIDPNEIKEKYQLNFELTLMKGEGVYFDLVEENEHEEG